MTELKPCPFCGENPHTLVSYKYCGGGSLTLVAEVKCECGISRGIQFEAEKKDFQAYIDAFKAAIALWNRRVET